MLQTDKTGLAFPRKGVLQCTMQYRHNINVPTRPECKVELATAFEGTGICALLETR